MGKALTFELGLLLTDIAKDSLKVGFESYD